MRDSSAESWAEAMRRGDFEAAWAINDCILGARDMRNRDDPGRPYHERWVWDGLPPTGRSVLVRCYHGLGDTIQFARYLPILDACAASWRIEIQPSLRPLLALRHRPERLISFCPDAPQPEAECNLEVMELAHALRLPPGPELASPYLSVPQSRVDEMRSRFGLNAGPSAGLCWCAGDWDGDRSIPLSILAKYVWGLDISWVSLQGGAAAADALRPNAPPLVNAGVAERDIVDCAALICAVDVVVTVDTMVAHLAGALGRLTFLLLKKNADWRWMLNCSETPWYPSIRIYRQPTAGDWEAPLACMRRDLQALLSWSP
jgi:ADP-heptose:LPS heptosyltransferase